MQAKQTNRVTQFSKIAIMHLRSQVVMVVDANLGYLMQPGFS